MAALGLSGCSHQAEPKPSPDLGTSTSTFDSHASTNTSPLPAPDALTDVLYRLADPAVKGSDKLDLIEDTTPADAATIDRFAIALRDNGFTPLTCTATDIAWSDHAVGNALATINITTSNPTQSGGFTFPMEFHPYLSGWQLSRQTADMVLAFGNARSDASRTDPTPAPDAPPGARTAPEEPPSALPVPPVMGPPAGSEAPSPAPAPPR